MGSHMEGRCLALRRALLAFFKINLIYRLVAEAHAEAIAPQVAR